MTTNKVFVSYLGCGYEVTYKWKDGVFTPIHIHPGVKKTLLYTHLMDKAARQAIADEYNEYCRDNPMPDADDDFSPEDIQLLQEYNTFVDEKA